MLSGTGRRKQVHKKWGFVKVAYIINNCKGWPSLKKLSVQDIVYAILRVL